MGSFASLAFGAFGNKSGSFWSVLGTPKMRRGKSEDILAGNKIVHSSDTTVQSEKRHSKGKLLGFLGSSADYLRGKINRNGHHTSLDSDSIQTHFKSSIPMQQNGHIGKRLVRGETIDTLSTESNDDITDRNCNVDDLSKQETVESSVAEADFSNAASPKNDLVFMHRAHSDSVGTRPPLQHGSRLLDSLDSMDIQRRASFGAMDSLTVHYRNPYNHSCSINNIDGKNHGNA
ncbi:hypothetical protein DPMN_012688 [Dreissena polymorpha]|uniref:Uncharacterized protein n=2 Tax=Dreissena polymorpha TaxID=45954 RepID=A0A9D4N2Y0_DREPO|nr:hypothetical protein DPMN_012688 [Dreissena polymorpha]